MGSQRHLWHHSHGGGQASEHQYVPSGQQQAFGHHSDRNLHHGLARGPGRAGVRSRGPHHDRWHPFRRSRGWGELYRRRGRGVQRYVLRPRNEHHGPVAVRRVCEQAGWHAPHDLWRSRQLAEEYWAKLAPNGTDEYHRQFYSYDKMIPTEMGTLKKLQVLKMDNSRFMKHIPTELGNMRSMRYWDVKGSDGIDMYSEGETNAVSGSIPTQIGRLKHLLTFNMENNTLSGTIPVDIANMTSLQRWVLPDNKLSGTIPNIFASMNMSLETWDPFNNKLTGDLPT